MPDSKSLIAERILIPITAVQPVAVSAESVTIPAGAAGTVVDCYFYKKPILKNTREFVGGFGNSSLVLTSATFTTEVSPETPDASLANGQYWVDYVTGRLRGRKANTGTSMTADYYVFQAVGSGGSSATITFYDGQFFLGSDGTVSGGNTSFTLPATPDANSLAVYLNGSRLRNNSTFYTLSGAVLTFPYLLDPTWEVVVDFRVTT